jgi:adenosylhomocysteine nucleosidase
MGHVAKVGIVVGLPQEAAILKQTLGDSTPALACAGPGPVRAARAAADLIAAGADALLSLGFAGGLDPALRPGDIVVGAGTAEPDGRRHETDDAMAQRLCAALDAANCPWSAGLVAGVDQGLATAADKKALSSRTHAVIVDMESHAIAAAGLPFAILRVVVDPAERALPVAVLAALSPGGEVLIPKLIAGLLRHPGDLRSVWALAGDSRRARAGLRRAATALGTVFAHHGSISAKA